MCFSIFYLLSARSPKYHLSTNCNVPAIISGVCGLLIGIGMGIGFGALIFHPFSSSSLGGGIWFGKKRKKRDSKYGNTKSNQYTIQTLADQNSMIVEKIQRARQLYSGK